MNDSSAVVIRSYNDRVAAKQNVIHVRLDDARAKRLTEFTEDSGRDRSEVLRAALDDFMAEADRKRAAQEFTDAWVAEHGPLDEASIEATGRRFFS